MEKLKTLFNEHKQAALIGLFLLIVFIGGSVVSAVNVAQHRAQENAEQPQQQEEVGGKQENGTADTADVKLSESQKDAIKAYDEETVKFIDTLSASVWSSGGGRYTLRFSDDSYVETVNGESTTHSFAITRIDESSDGYGGTYRTAVFDTDTGTHIVTYTDGKGSAVRNVDKKPAKGEPSVVSTIESTSMFAQKNTPYERIDSIEHIVIKGLNSEMTELLGDDLDKLVENLSSWCAVHYPTATEATWEKVAIMDYEEGVISTNFTLNTESSVAVAVNYKTSDGTFSFND